MTRILRCEAWLKKSFIKRIALYVQSLCLDMCVTGLMGRNNKLYILFTYQYNEKHVMSSQDKIAR